MNMNYLESINMNWKMLTLYDYVLKELKWIELNMFNCIKHIYIYIVQLTSYSYWLKITGYCMYVTCWKIKRHNNTS